MFRRASIAAACLAVLALVHAKEVEVVTLNGEAAFDKAVAESTFLVAEFYAPWCGHCKSLAPEYEKAAKELKSKGLEIVLAKIDTTLDENKPLATRFDINGFPTLKVFRNGNVDAPADYNGPREAAGIVSYLEKVSGPASRELKTADEVAAFRKKDLALLGAFAPDSVELGAFLAAAETLREDFDCAHVLDASLLSEAKAAPAVVLLKSFDEPVTQYKGKFTDAELAQFALANSEPVLAEMDQTTRNKRALQRIFGDQTRPKFLAVVPKDKLADKLKAEMTAAASDEANKEKLSFLWVDPTTPPQVGKFFGLEDADYPAFAIHDQAGDGKYLSRNVKAGDVKKYVKDFLAGKLEKTVKSEPVPASNDGPVKVLVASQFDELVTDSGKFVLIEFYAPWCGHCQSLAPVYEQVGEAYASNDNVMIAKMDATANDVPSSLFKVQGFPTLFLYNGKTKAVVPYEGNRSLEDMVEFVALHSGEAAPATGGAKLEQPGTEDEDEEDAKDEL